MVDPKRLIESMELCRGEDRDCQQCMYWETENDCRDSMIHDAVDVIKVLAQIGWELDVALNQLSQIGKGLGEKMDDIVELQKKHEPHVLTTSEIESSEVVWFEARTSLYVEPMLTRGKKFADESAPWFQYGRDWRCWSSRPTDEQREAVKWDD